MVCVPGLFGISEFRRETLSEEAKIKTEAGIEAPAKEGLSQPLEGEGSSDRRSLGGALTIIQ